MFGSEQTILLRASRLAWPLRRLYISSPTPIPAPFQLGGGFTWLWRLPQSRLCVSLLLPRKEIKDRLQPSHSKFLGLSPPWLTGSSSTYPLQFCSPGSPERHAPPHPPHPTPACSVHPLPLSLSRRTGSELFSSFPGGRGAHPPPPSLHSHIWFVNLSRFSLWSLPAAVSSVEFRPKMGVGGQWGNHVRAKGGDPWLDRGRQRRLE